MEDRCIVFVKWKWVNVCGSMMMTTVKIVWESSSARDESWNVLWWMKIFSSLAYAKIFSINNRRVDSFMIWFVFYLPFSDRRSKLWHPPRAHNWGNNFSVNNYCSQLKGKKKSEKLWSRRSVIKNLKFLYKASESTFRRRFFRFDFGWHFVSVS